MKKIIKLAFLMLIAGYFQQANATTFTAASCNVSDVASAVNSAVAAGSGNTVKIPAGTCTWTSPLNINLGSTISLSIIGAGNTSVGGGDLTNIIDNVNHGSSDFTVSIQTGGPSTSFRWSGITISANGSSTTSNNGVFRIGGTSQSVRIDHNHFNKNNQLELDIEGQIFGVLDHDLFDQADLGVRHLATNWSVGTPGNGDQYGDGSWNDVTSLGSNRYIYVEDSIFNSTSTGTATPANDCLSGGRFVIRFSTFNGGAALQTHPTGHAGDDRGCRSWEIYKNTFTNGNTTSNPEYNMFFMSAGTGVIWGNTANQYKNFVTMHSMRANSGTYQQSARPSGWGYCGTEYNGTGSTWDKNSSSLTGYPCLDQPGTGKSDLIGGAFPSKCDKTTGCSTNSGTFPNQITEPIYEWMDGWTGVSGYPGSFWSVVESDRFTNNVDYYQWCNPSSSSGCTSFNGTVGVGSGTLAARPSTCKTGVAYWATDQGSWNSSGSGGQGQLYKCTSTDTWSVFYTPYTYPHPLISSQTAQGPLSPVNVQSIAK